ncbi:MAG TPA: TIGR03960 family B12-binding radical SAM protein [Polyangiaceae bacterium]|nr:TIGR03960 family B12-binding radical SAM protein [Polyangiaceae bacterium]
MQLLDHPYAKFLDKVEKPNRYTGAEHGVRRKVWDGVEARICLAFPEIYDIGMSHLGYRILYRILNDDPRTLAERAYLPWTDMQRQLHEHGKLLVSLESSRPLCDFDVVGFSLQYELTYTNVLTMLELSGIPLRSAARSEADPLIIAGGPVATHCEPAADFFDAILIGDGEEAATEIALCWAHAKREGLSRSERLVRLAQIRGVYVPSLYETALDPVDGFVIVTGPKVQGIPFPIERRLLDDISKFPFPDDGPVGGPEAIFDRMSIEVARGCTEGCRFCQAGMIYRPVRERDPEQVIDTVLRALEKSGQDEVSLTALSTADVSCISPLIKRLVEKTAPERVSLGVASLRAYGLAEDLLDDMRKVRASGLTFAPEAGTQRMRDVINKNVTEAQLLETAERTFSRGFDRMKLYFIIGLPTEEDEDVLGIAAVGKNALQVGKRVGGRPKVTVSVSTHVPKPHTPLQWCAQDSLAQTQRKQQMLRHAVKQVRGLELRTHDSETSILEGILARGDRRLSAVIERAYHQGARLDSWEEHVKLDVWREALEHCRVDPAQFLGTIPVNARLPWAHFDIGLEEGFLAREYRKALASRSSPPCGKVVGQFIHATNLKDAKTEQRRLVCYDCGIACDLTQMRTDRQDFLQRLGALEPNQRVSLPVVQEPLGKPSGPEREPLVFGSDLPPEELAKPIAQRKRVRPELYRPVRVGTPVRYRIRFAKTGAVALLGHLDLIRELPRVIRRAGIRTAYTEGFHPKPDMSFGPALSLGVASLDEYADVKLIDAPPEEELTALLDAHSSGGLRFLGARQLTTQDKGVAAVISASRYLLALPRTVVDERGGVAFLERSIEEFLSKPELIVYRSIDGLGKKVDVRRFVRELRVAGEPERGALSQAGLIGDLVAVEAVVALGPTGSAKAAEVVEALLGPGFPHKAVRLQLLAGDASPLDIVRLRSARQVVEAALALA